MENNLTLLTLRLEKTFGITVKSTLFDLIKKKELPLLDLPFRFRFRQGNAILSGKSQGILKSAVCDFRVIVHIFQR